jgi:hypothetical protein
LRGWGAEGRGGVGGKGGGWGQGGEMSQALYAHMNNKTTTTKRFHLAPVRMTTIKKTNNKNVGKDLGQKKPS